MGLRVRQATGEPRSPGTPLAGPDGRQPDRQRHPPQPAGRLDPRRPPRDGPAARLVVENGGPVLDPGKVTSWPSRSGGWAPTVPAPAHGTGLGLSIVDAIATAHGGTLRLRARPEGGLRVGHRTARAAAPAAAQPAGRAGR